MTITCAGPRAPRDGRGAAGKARRPLRAASRGGAVPAAPRGVRSARPPRVDLIPGGRYPCLHEQAADPPGRSQPRRRAARLRRLRSSSRDPGHRRLCLSRLPSRAPATSPRSSLRRRTSSNPASSGSTQRTTLDLSYVTLAGPRRRFGPRQRPQPGIHAADPGGRVQRQRRPSGGFVRRGRLGLPGLAEPFVLQGPLPQPAGRSGTRADLREQGRRERLGRGSRPRLRAPGRRPRLAAATCAGAGPCATSAGGTRPTRIATAFRRPLPRQSGRGPRWRPTGALPSASGRT